MKLWSDAEEGVGVVEKWGRALEKGGAVYEASTCFNMSVKNTSSKYVGH
jgi:hypothetical protein